ncbi:MAG: hypothetical protein LBG46_00930 [Elusimicrobiota bacterium]|jgi:uncharacterized membrane protein|nr:hypothetical protein [Elusimicrobiota bacterium]
MKSTELQKIEIIEPEVITPQIGETFERQTYAAPNKSDSLAGFARAVFTFILGAIMLFIFLLVFILLAIPMLLLALFGKKPNVKIFKYRI